MLRQNVQAMFQNNVQMKRSCNVVYTSVCYTTEAQTSGNVVAKRFRDVSTQRRHLTMLHLTLCVVLTRRNNCNL